MRVVIIGNGCVSAECVNEYIKNEDLIICCDGGLNFAFNEGITPHLIIGDFDSVSPQVLDFFEKKDIKINRFPQEKDYTDMEICVEFAAALDHVDEILIFGGLGGRFDHSLANANILKRAVDKGVTARLIDTNNTVYLIKDEITLSAEAGTFVSLIPLSQTVVGVTTAGLYYPLDNAEMHIGVSVGVSNKMVDETASVSIKSGYLFVILARD